MADRRCISKEIYTQRRFLQLSPTTQNLYTYLVLFSDIDGVVEAYSVMQMIGASQKDLENLNEEHYIKVLNHEWVTYIEEFHRFNTLDGRGMRGSKYRDLLVSIKPNAQLTELKPKKKKADKKQDENTNIESHRNHMGITCITEPNLIEPNLIDDNRIINQYHQLFKLSTNISSKTNEKIKKIIQQYGTNTVLRVIHSVHNRYMNGYMGTFQPNINWLFGEGWDESLKKANANSVINNENNSQYDEFIKNQN